MAVALLVGGLPQAAHGARTKASSEPMERTIEILGWKPDESQLLYREDTLREAEYQARAVLLQTKDGKILKELAIQEPSDTPDVISVRENNLAVMAESEGFRLGPVTPFFVSRQTRGYLTPGGQVLLQSDLQFQRHPKNRKNQQLRLFFRLVHLQTGDQWDVAEVFVDQIDGETPLTTDSIGSVTVSEVSFSPKGSFFAAVLEEKRRDTKIQGVVVVKLGGLVDIMQSPDPLRVAGAPAPSRTEVAPVLSTPSPSASPAPMSTPSSKTDRSASAEPPRSKTPAPLAELSPPTGDLGEQYLTPEGGKPMDLRWARSAQSSSPDRRYSVALVVYEACQREAISSLVLIQDSNQSTLSEVPLAKSLAPEKISIETSKLGFRIMYLGEVLRQMEWDQLEFQPLKRSPRAFALQTGSFSTEETAQKQAADFCQVGLPAYILQTQEEGSGGVSELRYRVRLGRFPTQVRAQSFAETWKEHLPKFLLSRF